uniref:Uncharacterized protein n=1 Tax=Arundo donax TaxID=35708 RepID=A0A0A9E6T7_ARUDO
MLNMQTECPMKSLVLMINYVNSTVCLILCLALELLMSNLTLAMDTYRPEPVHIGELVDVVPLLTISHEIKCIGAFYFSCCPCSIYVLMAYCNAKFRWMQLMII